MALILVTTRERNLCFNRLDVFKLIFYAFIASHLLLWIYSVFHIICQMCFYVLRLKKYLHCTIIEYISESNMINVVEFCV